MNSPHIARASGQSADLSVLGQRLREIPVTSASADQAIGKIVQLVFELAGAFGVAYFSRNEQARLTVCGGHYAPAQLNQPGSLSQQMHRLSLAACSEQRLQVGRPEAESPLLIVSVPIGADAELPRTRNRA